MFILTTGSLDWLNQGEGRVVIDDPPCLERTAAPPVPRDATGASVYNMSARIKNFLPKVIKCRSLLAGGVVDVVGSCFGRSMIGGRPGREHERTTTRN